MNPKYLILNLFILVIAFRPESDIIFDKIQKGENSNGLYQTTILLQYFTLGTAF